MDTVPCLAVDDRVVLAGVAFALVDRLADIGAIVQHAVEVLLVDAVAARRADAAGRRIPWSEVSRINDDEMRALMREIVDRLYTFHRRIDDPTFRAGSIAGPQ